jgi:hypothetical protein
MTVSFEDTQGGLTTVFPLTSEPDRVVVQVPDFVSGRLFVSESVNSGAFSEQVRSNVIDADVAP